jgi:hypothetical protein
VAVWTQETKVLDPVVVVDSVDVVKVKNKGFPFPFRTKAAFITHGFKKTRS